MRNDISRKASFVIIAAIYVAAAAVGYLFYRLSLSWGAGFLLSLLVADTAATIFVWGWGLAFRNVSVYDPYWSVAPPVILTWLLLSGGSLDLPTALMLTAVWYWAIRLTGNWAVCFKGLAHEDWRYTRYRTEKSPFVFHVINFFGLNMVPTIVVFLAIIPAVGLVQGSFTATPLTWVAFLMALACPTLQLIADRQSHAFRKEHPGEVCCIGLWKHGRHPNYLGEVMMWWSVWLIYVSAAGLGQHTWYIAGAIANTLLFLFISIPMMEKRQLKNKPGYADYKKRTRLFI